MENFEEYLLKKLKDYLLKNHDVKVYKQNDTPITLAYLTWFEEWMDFCKKHYNK